MYEHAAVHEKHKEIWTLLQASLWNQVVNEDGLWLWSKYINRIQRWGEFHADLSEINLKCTSHRVPPEKYPVSCFVMLPSSQFSSVGYHFLKSLFSCKGGDGRGRAEVFSCDMDTNHDGISLLTRVNVDCKHKQAKSRYNLNTNNLSI